jgi:glucokinase
VRSSDSGDPGGLAIGADIGGTKIALGVVSDAGELLADEVVPTPTDDEAAIIAVIQAAAARFRDVYPGITALGAGAPGWVEYPAGIIRFSPYIAFSRRSLRDRLAAATGLPVVVDNDANLAAWAEARFGATPGASPLLLLTLGTGIGGGLVAGGEVYRGRNSLGAEVGHVIVDPDGERCGCGNRGCLEAVASGTALGRAGRALAEADPGGMLARLGAGTGTGTGVTGATVTQAARAGDQAATELLGRAGYWCGIAAASLVAMLDPEVIVVAGGLAEAGDLLLGPMRASLAGHVFAGHLREAPPVVVSRLGARAGVIGAGAFSRHVQAGPRRRR